MRIKISTPQSVVYQGEIATLSVPTENGNLTINEKTTPMVSSIKPGIVSITPFDKSNIIHISIEKGMLFVDGKIIRIVSSSASTQGQINKESLEVSKKNLEERIKLLRRNGSIEEIERDINKLEKIKADLLLSTY